MMCDADIDAYHRLLAGQLSDTAMDSDCDEEEIELTSEELLEASTTTPDFIINEAPLVLPMPLPSQDDGDSPADWQYVLPRGKSTGMCCLSPTFTEDETLTHALRVCYVI